jgi:SAM-dependent methyltransferase
MTKRQHARGNRNWTRLPRLTVHRRWLDALLDSIQGQLAGKDVVDLGGKRVGPRGDFRPPFDQVRSWRFVNIQPKTRPDMLADVSFLPLRSACCDVVICTEVIEHLRYPAAAAAEMARILRPGGQVFASIPFMYCVHGDPQDFQRYTPDGIRRLFAEFREVSVVPMGGFWAVVEMTLHSAAQYWPDNGRIRRGLARRTLSLAANLIGKFDAALGASGVPLLANYLTTGYWATAIRPKDDRLAL